METMKEGQQISIYYEGENKAREGSYLGVCGVGLAQFIMFSENQSGETELLDPDKIHKIVLLEDER